MSSIASTFGARFWVRICFPPPVVFRWIGHRALELCIWVFCSLLVVGRIRNEVVYILSGRNPLHLYLAKQMWHIGDSLGSSSHLPLAVAKWAWRLDSSSICAWLTVAQL